MTPPEYRDQALQQAKVDALAATEAFLDAVGRLMLLHVEIALDTVTPALDAVAKAFQEAEAVLDGLPTTTPAPTPEPSKGLAKVPGPRNIRKTLLATLLEHDERDALFDQEGLSPSERNALHRLKHDHLATHVGGGLWRPTLKGLTRARAERGDTR